LQANGTSNLSRFYKLNIELCKKMKMLRTAYKQLKNLTSIYFYFREKVNKITQEGKLLLNKFL